jgi:ribonuclease III
MDAASVDELGERLGLALSDPELVRQAFVHSSYFNENPTAVAGHNERLEFYGDAVIGHAVSRLLYDRYPEEDEGFLTARRAALVNRDALAATALELGLDRLLLLGRGEADAGGATRPSVLAGCLEALAGALSLSEGDEATERVLRRVFEPRLDSLNHLAGPPKSAKSLLQEWMQRHDGSKPLYRVVSIEGPPHDQQFRVEVRLNGRTAGAGVGSSRQRAEERAAAAALLDVADRPDAEPPGASLGTNAP